MSFTGFRLVDDMGGNWTSSCSCWTHPEHISHNTLPEEDATPGTVGQLRTMYGMRDVAHECGTISRTRKLLQSATKSEKSSPCIHVHNTEPSTGWRHGDDILIAGEEKFVDENFDKLNGEMMLEKRAKFGSAETDDRHCTILDR